MVKHITASLGMVMLAGSMAFAAQSTAPTTAAPNAVRQSPSATSATKAATKKHHKHHKKAAAQKSDPTPQSPSASK